MESPILKISILRKFMERWIKYTSLWLSRM